MSPLKEITIRDVLAVLFSIGAFSLVFMKIDVPDQIWSAELVILTFFFSAPKQNSTMTNIETPKSPL